MRNILEKIEKEMMPYKRSWFNGPARLALALSSWPPPPPPPLRLLLLYFMLAPVPAHRANAIRILSISRRLCCTPNTTAAVTVVDRARSQRCYCCMEFIFMRNSCALVFLLRPTIRTESIIPPFLRSHNSQTDLCSHFPLDYFVQNAVDINRFMRQ